MTEDMGTTARGSLSGRRKLAIWEREKGCCMESVSYTHLTLPTIYSV